MQKIYISLLAVLAFFATGARAQTILEEDFETGATKSQSTPLTRGEGWTTVNSYSGSNYRYNWFNEYSDPESTSGSTISGSGCAACDAPTGGNNPDGAGPREEILLSPELDLNDTYQFLVEKFYDMVKINRDLRDLDFKKNLEAKEAFCQEAERLAENENVVDAFRELQKLHEQWKEFGPVAKEFREAIWDRFKAATAVINKKYQAYFEGQKEKFAENLQAKTALCEKVEAFAAQEIASSNEWNAISKKIEDIQKEWRSIGFASKKDNQKIYDRFRAACDAFYGRKRDFYSQYKDSMNENLDKKLAIIEKAEALKESKDWKKTTDLFIELQKEWKEIGAVPRKKSEQLWKRFRAACDAFFDAKAKEGKADNEFYANLKAKRALIEEIQAFEGSDEAAMQDFAARWQAIGFVPFKEKENVAKAYAEAMKAKFPSFGARPQRGGRAGAPKAPKSEKDLLVDQYKALQQDIVIVILRQVITTHVSISIGTIEQSRQILLVMPEY